MVFNIDNTERSTYSSHKSRERHQSPRFHKHPVRLTYKPKAGEAWSLLPRLGRSYPGQQSNNDNDNPLTEYYGP